MFATLSNFLHRTPWWALLLLGLAVLALLGLFTTPFKVIQLQRSGDTPEQKRAIQREIDSSFGKSVLGVAEEVVTAIHQRSQDPAHKAELDRAIREIARARKEIDNELSGVDSPQREAVREARRAIREAASEAAQEAYDAAVEAREKIEQKQQEVRQALKDAKVPLEEWPSSLNEAFKAARNAEEKAKKKRDQALAKLKEAGVPIDTGPGKDQASSGAAEEVKPQSAQRPAQLPDELRQDINSKVASDLVHIGVGASLILLFVPLFMMALVAKFFIDRARRSQDLAELKNIEAEHHNINRQITEAKLQALQAQVEPHFLYNTLANVQALTEVDPVAAHAMVGHLIQYLRAALPKMRENVSTVGQEVELVRSYLNILKMRMGDRLSFTIAVDEAAKTLAFPPLMLPSLVENAIKHGLEPQREGGQIDIMARVMNGRLSVSVKDTGRGFKQDQEVLGGGVGLSNLRERLAALYGTTASFSILANPPHGVVATIEMPATTTPPSAAKAPSAAEKQDQPSAAPRKGAKVWSVLSRTHAVWGKIISFTFIALMLLLAVAFGIALAAVFAGAIPIQVGNVQLHGIEGMALSSLGLLAVFAAIALVLFGVVALIYGLGVLLAGLLIFIPMVILIALFPALAPLILIGLLVYWLVRRRKTRKHGDADNTLGNKSETH
ncbi:MAG: histidine kinase [Betaproteobacteria bacterium]|nr:histidine kinase [Betaproteobacteria bacterium]